MQNIFLEKEKRFGHVLLETWTIAPKDGGQTSTALVYSDRAQTGWVASYLWKSASETLGEGAYEWQGWKIQSWYEPDRHTSILKRTACLRSSLMEWLHSADPEGCQLN